MQSTRPSLASRLRGVAVLLLVNFVGLLLVLLVAEGVSRLAGLLPRGGNRGDRLLWRYEALRGWGLIPGARGEDNRGGPDRGTVRINAQGFRGADFARTKGRDTRRILILGDSFGFGVGVNEEHTMAVRLADLINHDPELTGGTHVDVLNLSVSGYSTDQEILTFEAEGAPLDPSVVILLICDNDFEGNLEGFPYGRYYKPRFVLDGEAVRLVDTPAPRGERRRPIRTWLFDHSVIQGALLKASSRPRLRALERFLS
ncbi:MAG: SGNH/GDSL hydrolase family protein, partial [Vicinamibacteria bacterium]